MTTRSTSDSSVSLCQIMRGSTPKDCFSAMAMSRSRLIPGKMTMPAFIGLLVLLVGLLAQDFGVTRGLGQHLIGRALVPRTTLGMASCGAWQRLRGQGRPEL